MVSVLLDVVDRLELRFTERSTVKVLWYINFLHDCRQAHGRKGRNSVSDPKSSTMQNSNDLLVLDGFL